MPHEIMTIEEVAEYLRVSERTVYDWAQKGQLPGGKLGTTWRFKRTDIEHWVSSRLGATPPEELYILYRIVQQRLDAAGAAIVMPLVGRYATSMEMAGVSFTICKLDDELEGCLKAPASCAFWQVG